MFQEEYSLIKSPTAGVKIKKMTMSGKSTHNCLVHKIMAGNMASF